MYLGDIPAFILNILFTVLIYVLPFWLFRTYRAKPANKIASIIFLLLYFCTVHVGINYFVYGYYKHASTPPMLWFFVSAYFLTAKNPKFVPKKMDYSESEAEEKEPKEENEEIEIELVDANDPHHEQQTAKKKFFRSNREKLLVGFIGLLLVGYFVSGYYFYSYYQTMEKENASLQRKLDDYTEVMERRADYGALKEKSDFIDAHAVFVGEDQYYYHTYDCPSRPNYFWIYNVNAAVGRGYHPCPTCEPPTAD